VATYKRRLNRIFGEDGRAVIVAMDHGSQGPMRGLEDPGGILDLVVPAGADAILTSYGIATKYVRKIERCGLILRIDGGSGFGTSDVHVWQRYPVSDAVAIGADAVGCMGLIGWPCEAMNLRYISQIASQCLATGMPLMVETMPFSATAPGPNMAGGIVKGARIAAEIGADFVKTRYGGEPADFQRAVQGTYVPIVMLGGPKTETDLALLRQVRETLDVGGAGVAMGRNIWQHAHPDRIVRALVAVVHQGATPERAMQEFL
jgi:class I fructose-bisphosphate aldolase